MSFRSAFLLASGVCLLLSQCPPVCAQGAAAQLTTEKYSDKTFKFTLSDGVCSPTYSCNVEWNFGDGTPAYHSVLATSTQSVFHDYQGAGSYNVVVALDTSHVYWTVVNLASVSNFQTYQQSQQTASTSSQSQTNDSNSDFFENEGNVAIVASVGGATLFGSGLAMYLRLRAKRGLEDKVEGPTTSDAPPNTPKASDAAASAVFKRQKSAIIEHAFHSDPGLPSTRSPSTLEPVASSLKIPIPQLDPSPESGSGQSTPSGAQSIPRNRARSNSNVGRSRSARRSSYMGPRPEFLNQMVAEIPYSETVAKTVEVQPGTEWWKTTQDEWKPWLSSKILPPVFSMSCHFMLVRGLHFPGIFRIPGLMAEVKSLRGDFEDGLQVDAHRMHDPLTIASLIKQELRDTMMDIVPMNAYQSLLDARRAGIVEDMKKVIDGFSEQQRIILKAVMFMFVEVTKHRDENGMDNETLAKAVGPSLFRNMHIASANALFIFWLNEYQNLF